MGGLPREREIGINGVVVSGVGGYVRGGGGTKGTAGSITPNLITVLSPLTYRCEFLVTFTWNDVPTGVSTCMNVGNDFYLNIPLWNPALRVMQYTQIYFSTHERLDCSVGLFGATPLGYIQRSLSGELIGGWDTSVGGVTRVRVRTAISISTPSSGYTNPAEIVQSYYYMKSRSLTDTKGGLNPNIALAETVEQVCRTYDNGAVSSVVLNSVKIPTGYNWSYVTSVISLTREARAAAVPGIDQTWVDAVPSP